MNGELVTSIATVVVPCFGVLWYAIKITIRAVVAENNEKFYAKLDEKYATKELIDRVVMPRLAKIETDYGIVQAQYTEIRIGKSATSAR
jgi:hypothetical protein